MPNQTLTTLTLKLEVTEDHIKNGRKKNCQYCPTALALIERVKKTWPTEKVYSITTGFSSSTVYGEHKSWHFFHPYSVRRFISNFDNDFEVAPFTDYVNYYMDRI